MNDRRNCPTCCENNRFASGSRAGNMLFQKFEAASPLCPVQEAEQEEVKSRADAQPPRSAKKGKASASSTPQTGSDKKERKGKHKGQH